MNVVVCLRYLGSETHLCFLFSLHCGLLNRTLGCMKILTRFSIVIFILWHFTCKMLWLQCVAIYCQTFEEFEKVSTSC